MRIAIANDHGGVSLKRLVADRLDSLGHQVLNLGTDTPEIVRYPLFAAKAIGLMLDREVDRAILICSTGIGMSIAANKFKGIRAALCTDGYMAKMTRRHNDSNVLCLGGKITGDNLALEICDIWLAEEFEGGRHNISLGIVSDIEGKLLVGGKWEG
ncbi:MAG: ribose 5-phosphate isomerase B [Planctomycetota bacterium]|jgi:ribose 5-phosphate isomerase B|nr:ribose 5-phosphate isomerase B [Planctomycetota bacterium]